MLKPFVRLCGAGVTVAAAVLATAQSGYAQSSCLVSIEGYLSTVPAFRAPDLQNVVRSLREQGALHLQSATEGRLSVVRDIPGYFRQRQDYINSSLEALANHTSQGGRRDESICNPPAGSQAMAWAATRMGVAFNTWAINTIRCAAGDNNLESIPQFCPYAVQTSAPAPSPAPRDDPKVFGRSARGG
jgi:hypothetical protein